MATVPLQTDMITPAITVQTDVLFPELYPETVSSELEKPYTMAERPSPTQKVTVSICSELMQHTSPVTAFDATEELVLLTDSAGQPMVFSIGNDKVPTHIFPSPVCALLMNLTNILCHILGNSV
jgi:hypothetical protein